jgi:tRNA A-37 threonylcarbamoyl transferase component Bud32
MIGKTIGNHKIIERLGAGGMGIVYKARQISLARLVAMKILPDRMTRETTFVQRFFNEARAIAALNHPNIVQIFDVGKEGDNYYYTMELVDGISLEEVVQKREPIPIARAASIISSVAKALAYTHRRGIVHRDIKPSNIMIDKAGRVKLADFGLALKEDSKRLTVEGGLIGTPDFMSPEQASGKTATALSDIYSLGIVFYELITGCSPFDAPSALAVIEKIKTEEPEPPRSVNPDIPLEIEEIIMRMMAKNPKMRYQDCREIRMDLKLFRTSESVAPSAALKPISGGSFVRKAAFALLIILAIGIGAQLLRDRIQREPAVETPIPIEVRDAMRGAAAHLIPMLIEAYPFPEIQLTEVQERSIILSGFIESETEPGANRRLSAIKLGMDDCCESVIINKQEIVRGGMEFEIELQCIPDILTLLGSDKDMLRQYPLSVRFWQRAEKSRREGIKNGRKNLSGPAEESFHKATELYNSSLQMAEFEREMSKLDRTLDTMRAEVDAAKFLDKVVLKSGKVLKCKITEENDGWIRFQSEIGMGQRSQNQIQSITRATSDEIARIEELQLLIGETQNQKENLQQKINAFHHSSI